MVKGAMDITDQPLQELQARLGAAWPALTRAQREALRTQAELRGLLAGLGSEEASVVVYGSLARAEWTRQSDVDWTLLIDGRADPAHLRAAREVARRLEHAGYE